MNNKPSKKLNVAVHKFTSCDGCQLAFIKLGDALFSLEKYLTFVHFAELGPLNENAEVDLAFVEGSISTPTCITRIKKIRETAKTVITIGACATSGGIQALRNQADLKSWQSMIYAKPDLIKTLKTSTAISDHIKVDYQLWGCPINHEQLLMLLTRLINNAPPNFSKESVCAQCKRQGYSCVLVSENKPCMGPVTKAGCNALCPAIGRDCYGCFGPKENINPDALILKLKAIGLSEEEISRRFSFIYSSVAEFKSIHKKKP